MPLSSAHQSPDTLKRSLILNYTDSESLISNCLLLIKFNMAQRGISEPSGFAKTERRNLLKEACQRRPLGTMKRGQSNYTKYLDSMQESLNKNIQENIFPYWRNHNSLKGNVSFSRGCNKSFLID